MLDLPRNVSVLRMDLSHNVSILRMRLRKQYHSRSRHTKSCEQLEGIPLPRRSSFTCTVFSPDDIVACEADISPKAPSTLPQAALIQHLELAQHETAALRNLLLRFRQTLEATQISRRVNHHIRQALSAIDDSTELVIDDVSFVIEHYFQRWLHPAQRQHLHGSWHQLLRSESHGEMHMLRRIISRYRATLAVTIHALDCHSLLRLQTISTSLAPLLNVLHVQIQMGAQLAPTLDEIDRIVVALAGDTLICGLEEAYIPVARSPVTQGQLDPGLFLGDTPFEEAKLRRTSTPWPHMVPEPVMPSRSFSIARKRVSLPLLSLDTGSHWKPAEQRYSMPDSAVSIRRKQLIQTETKATSEPVTPLEPSSVTQKRVSMPLPLIQSESRARPEQRYSLPPSAVSIRRKPVGSAPRAPY